jgi:hypothetical protein
MAAGITVTGLKESIDFLNTMPKALVAKGFVKAGHAAGDVMLAAVIAHTPVSGAKVTNPTTGVETSVGTGGDLISAARMQVFLDAQYRGVQVQVDFGKLDYIAYWLEYGHRMIGHKPEKKQLFGPNTPDGNVKPYPIFRPAADECFEAAVQAFADSIAETVNEFQNQRVSA